MNDQSHIRLEGPALSELRNLAIERDGWHCVRCGVSISDHLPDWHPRKAHMAHIISRGRGGPDTLGNVEMCCACCHITEEHMGGKMVAAK